MSEKQNLTLGRQSSKYLLLPVVIACAALLASCGGGSDSTSTAESADGTKEALAVSGSSVVPPGWTGRAPKMEVINGITVPPEPAPSINNATLAGVDVNNNVVRDDVERLIAQKISSTKEKQISAIAYASAEQKMITVGNNSEYIRQVVCKVISREEANAITKKMLNTPARAKEYGKSLAGAIIPSGREGC